MAYLVEFRLYNTETSQIIEPVDAQDMANYISFDAKGIRVKNGIDYCPFVTHDKNGEKVFAGDMITRLEYKDTPNDCFREEVIWDARQACYLTEEDTELVDYGDFIRVSHKEY